MKKELLLIAFFLMTYSFSKGQIIADLADATVGDTSFTVGGFEFALSEDLIISEFDDFSCDGSAASNKYIDSGHMDAPSEGILGAITPVDPLVFFQVSTSDTQCGWPGSADGELTSTGTIKFVGTKLDGSNIEESFELASMNFNDLVPFTFSNSIWGGMDLNSLQIEIEATQDSTDYFALDNLTFELITMPTNINTIEDQLVNIFPNPTNGVITIEGAIPNRIEVVNIHGQVLSINDNPARTLDISELPNSIYFLKIYANDQVINKMIIKE